MKSQSLSGCPGETDSEVNRNLLAVFIINIQSHSVHKRINKKATLFIKFNLFLLVGKILHMFPCKIWIVLTEMSKNCGLLVNWSSKLMNALPKETLRMGLKDSGRELTKDTQRLSDTEINLIYPGLLIPGITQLKAFNYWYIKHNQ